jgi:hypothetical protein
VTLADIIPAALAELRDAAYVPTSGDEAIAMTMRYFGTGRDAAVFFLTGARDVVEIAA